MILHKYCLLLKVNLSMEICSVVLCLLLSTQITNRTIKQFFIGKFDIMTSQQTTTWGSVDYQKAIKFFSSNDHFGNLLGYKILSPKSPDSGPTCEMVISQKHLSPAGVCHGEKMHTCLIHRWCTFFISRCIDGDSSHCICSNNVCC